MQTALEKSANRYQDLCAKYLELENTVANNATHVTDQVEDAGQAYVVALIDAHTHNVSLLIDDTKDEVNNV